MEQKNIESKDLKSWKPTNRRYVCFIDIMGFKDMVATKQHSDIYEMMEKIVSCQESNSSITWAGDALMVKTTTYSDSIIVYSLDDSCDSLHNIICTVSGLVQDLLEEGIPHKGAMSVGTMTCDTEKSIYFGQPLIDSYLLQEELYFYGIVLHGSAEREYMKLKDKLDFEFIQEYNCPFKKGRTKHVTISPILLSYDKEDDVESNDLLIKSVNNMKFNTSGNLRIYIDSTIKYLNYVREC